MKTLTSLSIGRLQLLEVGQHMKSVLKGIDELGAGLITDAILTDYLSKTDQASNQFDKGLLKIMKSDETAKIVEADAVRDKALNATLRYLDVFEISEDAAERDAFASLNTLFKTYKGIQKWNFEEESNGIDNLLADLQDAKYLAHVGTLHMDAYIVRVKTTNEKFKTLFAGRTQEKASKEYFDTKALRDELVAIYYDLTEYVAVMARATGQEQYTKTLDVINAVRKYYADLLAKRKGTKKGEMEEPIPPME